MASSLGATPALASSSDYMTQLDLLFGITDEEIDFCLSLPETEQERFEHYLLGKKLHSLLDGAAGLEDEDEGEVDAQDPVSDYWFRCTRQHPISKTLTNSSREDFAAI